MPFKHHKVFSPVPSPDARLWRYMSLAKFLSLLHTSELFLSNLELMARSDPFEGTLPPSRFVHRKWVSVNDVPGSVKSRLTGFLNPHGTSLDTAFDRYRDARELGIRQAFAHRRSYFINCWHIAEHESAAMWGLYSKNDEGIAIVSSEQRIIDALYGEKKDILGGKISYADYETEEFVMDDSNCFIPVLHKRLSFTHEQEYRLVYWDTAVTHKTVEVLTNNGPFRSTIGRTEEEIEQMTPHPGYGVQCDLTILIESVYVSPLSPPWFIQTVQLASRAAKLAVEPKPSLLLSQPLK